MLTNPSYFFLFNFFFFLFLSLIPSKMGGKPDEEGKNPAGHGICRRT
jgi:hypothetical protein